MKEWRLMSIEERKNAVLHGQKWGLPATSLAIYCGATKNSIIGFAYRHFGGYKSGAQTGRPKRVAS